MRVSYGRLCSTCLGYRSHFDAYNHSVSRMYCNAENSLEMIAISSVKFEVHGPERIYSVVVAGALLTLTESNVLFF